MRKDKQKVVDEVWTEERVRSFLEVRSHDGSSDDFHMLLKAYQSMRAADFELFVGFFVEQGRDLQAPRDVALADATSEPKALAGEPCCRRWKAIAWAGNTQISCAPPAPEARAGDSFAARAAVAY